MMNDSPAEWSPRLKVFWALVGGPICLLWGLALVVRLSPPYRHLHDFVQEWTSARNFFVGQPIYLRLSESIPQHLGSNYQAHVIDVNAHPPASVLLTLPFAKLDYGSAYLAWNLLSLLMLALSLWLIMRPQGLRYSPWSIVPILVLILTSNSLAQQVNQGQLNLVLLLLLTLAWSAGRSNLLLLSGALIGAAAAIKLFPAFLGLYFLCRRQWQGVIGMGLAFVGLNVLTGAILGWGVFAAYFVDVVPQVGQFRDFWPNASIAGFWSKLFDSRSGHAIPLWQNALLASSGTILCCLLVTGAVAWKCWWAKGRAASDHAFALCVIAMLLVSPITWDHYFLLLVLPFAVLWRVLPATTFNRIALVAAIITLGVINPKWIWDATIPGDGELAWGEDVVVSVATPLQTLTVVSYQLYALLTLFVLGLVTKSLPSDRKVTDD